MNVLTVAVIALCGLSWTLLDLSRKKLTESLEPDSIVLWLMAFQAPLFLLLSWHESWRVPASAYWWPAAGSVVLNLAANLLLVFALGLAPFSLALPVLSLAPVFSAVGGLLVLGEDLAFRQGFGISVVVIATFMLSRFGAAREAPGREEAVQIRRGLVLMVIVALFFALAPILDKLCLAHVPGGEHAFLQCLAIALAMAFVSRWRKRSLQIQEMKSSLAWFAFATVIAALALGTQLWAIQFAPVGIFEALKRATGMVSSLALGSIFFREPVTKLKLGVVCAIGLGIFALLV